LLPHDTGPFGPVLCYMLWSVGGTLAAPEFRVRGLSRPLLKAWMNRGPLASGAPRLTNDTVLANLENQERARPYARPSLLLPLSRYRLRAGENLIAKD
jgi:hypothetical protein